MSFQYFLGEMIPHFSEKTSFKLFIGERSHTQNRNRFFSRSILSFHHLIFPPLQNSSQQQQQQQLIISDVNKKKNEDTLCYSNSIVTSSSQKKENSILFSFVNVFLFSIGAHWVTTFSSLPSESLKMTLSLDTGEDGRAKACYIFLFYYLK